MGWKPREKSYLDMKESARKHYASLKIIKPRGTPSDFEVYKNEVDPTWEERLIDPDFDKLYGRVESEGDIELW